MASFGQTCKQTSQPKHWFLSIKAFFVSLLTDIAGHPVFVHFLHPTHFSSSTTHLSVNTFPNSSISACENLLRAHGHLVIITDASSKPIAQSRASLTSSNLFGFITLTFLAPKAFTTCSIFIDVVSSPCSVNPEPGFSCYSIV